MKLTAENVETIFSDCLFKDGEDTSKAVIAQGVISKFGFHPERLSANADTIKILCDQLPEQFQHAKGGGWSFLNACMTAQDEQWGEHRNIEQLLALAIASKYAVYLMPREAWSMMPGGMPYFSVGNISARSK